MQNLKKRYENKYFLCERLFVPFCVIRNKNNPKWVSIFSEEHLYLPFIH